MKYFKLVKDSSLLLLLLTMTNCEVIEIPERNYGLVLTVDDGYVDYWFEYIDYLEDYNASLTLYITNYLSLSSEQIVKLKSLADRGHEIGFHGTHHVSVNSYLEENSISEYMNEEIMLGLEAMRRDSFTINHFAYPYGDNNNTIDSLLLYQFISIRKIAGTKDKTLKEQEAVRFTLPCSQWILRAVGIDSTYNVPLEDIIETLDDIATTRETLMLYCHKLTNEPGKWHISVEKMKGIIEHCYDNNVPMLTVQEMYEAPIFLD